MIEGDFSESSGRGALETLLAREVPFNGIVFGNDDVAIGGLEALKRADVRVPEDVSIIGFDDFGLSRLTTPCITTMRAPAEDLARIARERLFKLIDGMNAGPSRIELPVRLIRRASCGC